MKITILGSSGQIGAYLTEYLRNKGHYVTEFDKNNSTHEDMTTIPNPFLRNAIIDSDFVFFLAFDVGGSRYLKKYQHTFKFIDNNARMLAGAFEYLAEYKKPFVFASSQMSSMSYSPYGVMKRVGELYTKSLGGLIVKFWNVYGIEKDHDKAHVITDFIRKGFETGVIDMLTDGTEQREFLYAEDCCEALESVMEQYTEHNSDSELHITSFQSTTILEIGKIIQGLFKSQGKKITLNPAQAKDEVQKDARNEANPYIKKWWKPRTSIEDGIEKIYEAMKKTMTNLTPLRNFIQEPHCDLGDNAWRLADLVRTMRNKRFIDLGVRLGASSAIMSIESDERNNEVCGCDLDYDGFFKNGRRFVSENYTCYQADSVTLGKNWDEDPFDIIFVDTIHTREQVLAELYFWSNHLNKNGYFVFHDSHWERVGGDIIGGVEWKRVDVAITDFFDLPKNVMELTEYENDDILLNHFPGSYGMTFIKVKNLEALERFKSNIDWKEVFDIRNELNDMHFNKDNPKFIDWNQDIPNIENELIITP